MLPHVSRSYIFIDQPWLYESFSKFLQQEEEAPDTIKELEQQAMIKLVLADSTDPDDVGFVRWRAAFYVAGDLINFLFLLDAFFVWINEGREERVTIALYPYLDVDILRIGDNLVYQSEAWG